MSSIKYWTYFQLMVPMMLQNQIQLKQWGLSLNLSRTLNKYIVTNCSVETHPNALYLVIQLQRLSEPFWMSLFVPSICLILAAEVALFIDETHFEALIMVSLTSNLVMYTLYNAIQADLPEDSTLKLIDIWLLHGLVMPMVVFIVLAVNELVASKNIKRSSLGSGTKVADSSVSFSTTIQEKEDFHGSKIQKCMFMCKVLIPITSALFILTFFTICLAR